MRLLLQLRYRGASSVPTIRPDGTEAAQEAAIARWQSFWNDHGIEEEEEEVRKPSPFTHPLEVLGIDPAKLQRPSRPVESHEHLGEYKLTNEDLAEANDDIEVFFGSFSAGTSAEELNTHFSHEKDEDFDAAIHAYDAAIHAYDHGPRVDFEDWHEDCARLVAALDTGLPFSVVSQNGRDIDGVSALDNWHERASTQGRFDPEEPFLFLGFGRGRSKICDHPQNLGVDRSGLIAAERYYTHRAWLESAGREVHLVNNPESWNISDVQTIHGRLMAMAKAGHKTAFIKDTRPKRGIFIVNLSGVTDSRSLSNAVLEDIGYGLEAAWDKDAFIVQEYLPMRDEYRLFVIDGQIIAGAGVVVAHTPLINDGVAFSPYVSVDPKNENLVRSDPDLVAAYLAFAEPVVARLRDEVPQMVDYSFDVAMTDRGIVSVEINPGLNLGLYGVHYPTVLAAHIRAAEAVLARRNACEVVPV